MQEWEQVIVATPAQALLVKSIELIDELQMLQLIPAASFSLPYSVHAAHFNSIQVTQDAENSCLCLE